MHQFPAPPDPPLPPAPTARPKHRRRPLATARTTSGTYSAANWVNDRHARTQARRARVLTAVMKLGLYLPREVAARLAVVPAELRAPVHPSQIPYLEIATKTLGSGGPDVPGRCAAGAFSAPRVRAAELTAARAERAALAPWRAVIAAARLAKREALAARRAARIGKHDKDPMPMERLPGAGLGARAAGIAAATEAGGAGTAAGVAAKGGAASEGSQTRPMNRRGGGGMAAAHAAAVAAKGGAASEGSETQPMNRGAGGGMAAAHADAPAAAVVPKGGAASEGSQTRPVNRGAGGGTAASDAILAALPNRAARRRWESLQRRKHRISRAIG